MIFRTIVTRQKIAGITTVLLILAASGYHVNASCAIEKYLIKGVIRDASSGKPIEDAAVFCFLDGAELVTCRANTSTSGEFQCSFPFNTFRRNGWLFFEDTDICDREPTTIELVIIKDPYIPVKRKFARKEFVLTEATVPKFIEVPQINLKIR